MCVGLLRGATAQQVRSSTGSVSATMQSSRGVCSGGLRTRAASLH